MGSTYSTNSSEQNGEINSEVIRQNILRAFQTKQTPDELNDFSNFDTLDWNSHQIPTRSSKMRSSQLGGSKTRNQARNRWEQYNPEALINELTRQTTKTKKNQAGGNSQLGLPISSESASYRELSDNITQLLREHVNRGPSQQTGGYKMNLANLSSTSSQPVDFSVLVGAGDADGNADGDADADVTSESDDESKKSEESEAESESDSDNVKEEEEEEINIDEDFDEDEGEESDSESEEVSEEEKPEMSRSVGKKGKADKKSKKSKYVDSTTSQSGIDDIIRPFYSSDSDYYNIRRRNKRFD